MKGFGKVFLFVLEAPCPGKSLCPNPSVAPGASSNTQRYVFLLRPLCLWNAVGTLGNSQGGVQHPYLKAAKGEGIPQLLRGMCDPGRARRRLPPHPVCEPAPCLFIPGVPADSRPTEYRDQGNKWWKREWQWIPGRANVRQKAEKFNSRVISWDGDTSWRYLPKSGHVRAKGRNVSRTLNAPKNIYQFLFKVPRTVGLSLI